MNADYEVLVGIDWGNEKHQLCCLARDGRRLLEREVDNSGPAIRELSEQLFAMVSGPAERLAIAIETPRGSLVEALVDRGFHVFAINPKQLDRFRDRHTVAGAKDDRLDAFVLAQSLGTDVQCFRRIELADPLVIQLRDISRIEENLGGELARASNRLRDQLGRFHKQALKLCPAADEPWLWSLLELAPTPKAGRDLRVSQVRRVMQKHKIRRFTPLEVLEVFRADPLPVAPGTTEAASEHVKILIPQLQLYHGQRNACIKRMKSLLEEMTSDEDEPGDDAPGRRDVEILLSFPGVGTKVASSLIGEAWQDIARRDHAGVRSHAGIAPVTAASGKRSGSRARVSMRRACNPRLRQAFHHWARVAAQRDPDAKTHYDSLRERGQSHGRALRGVADRLLRILMGALTHQTLYDPRRRTRHLQVLAPVADTATAGPAPSERARGASPSPGCPSPRASTGPFPTRRERAITGSKANARAA